MTSFPRSASRFQIGNRRFLFVPIRDAERPDVRSHAERGNEISECMLRSLSEKLRLFDPDLPLERARTIPSSWYADPEIYAAECRSVFGGTWQAAARLEQLGQPGSFVTTMIAGEPILVLRDEQGHLRAFFNVCRHRAAVVVNEP